MTTTEAFAALMPQPFDHLYEFASPFGGTTLRESASEYNGNRPKRSIALYTAEQMRAMFDAATERAAKQIEALRDSHCKSTQQSPNEENWCEPNDVTCEFVVAWNDAIAAIRARDEGVSNA